MGFFTNKWLEATEMAPQLKASTVLPENLDSLPTNDRGWDRAELAERALRAGGPRVPPLGPREMTWRCTPAASALKREKQEDQRFKDLPAYRLSTTRKGLPAV